MIHFPEPCFTPSPPLHARHKKKVSYIQFSFPDWLHLTSACVSTFLGQGQAVNITTTMVTIPLPPIMEQCPLSSSPHPAEAPLLPPHPRERAAPSSSVAPQTVSCASWSGIHSPLQQVLVRKKKMQRVWLWWGRGKKMKILQDPSPWMRRRRTTTREEW